MVRDDGGTSAPPAEVLTFPEAFRAAVSSNGRSLDSLRRRLQERGITISIATLSYWQSGRSQPQRMASLEAVAHLEEILAVPRGHLLGRLGPRRRPGPPRSAPPAAQLPADVPLARHVMDQLGFGLHHELVDVTIHDTLEIDCHGVPRVRTVRETVRAVKEGAQRIPAFLALDEPVGEVATFTEVSGCRLGRKVSYPDEGVFAAEFLLDRPLGYGESAAAEHRVDLPAGFGTCVEYFLMRRVTELVLWVRFDPGMLPSTVETYSHLEGRHQAMRVDLAESTSVQQVLHGVGPGRVGVRWTW